MGRRPPRPPGRALAALTAALCVLLLAGCGARLGEDGRIGVVYMDAQGFYAGVREGMQNYADDSGRELQLLELNARGDASEESTFVDVVSSADVDALVLSPVSATASVPAVRLAHESGIPVICYNTCIEDEAAKEYVTSYILGDPHEFGRLLGDAAADHFEDEGVEDPQIGVLNCEFVEVCVQRREGFEEALFARLPDARIVANQEGATIDEAVNVGERLLTAHPDLDAFYGEAGGATMGAVRAVTNRGLAGEVVVFGSDMSTDAARALSDHRILKANVDISGIAVGLLAGETVERIIAGEAPEEFVTEAPIDLYTTPEDGEEWLEEHPDGVP
ncbi:MULTISPECIES: substrate-binding domain-containing protein [Nocardiopsis]|jgi:ABC-type sugar transport system substrate-binding protein|uniref:Periplasmic binding protein/LacI transcriptional regulator n=1 Tax=Nocardiopsis dassonvillei (strain ATCC 23218 / DSM 43111 / CIP 107115 / JCM 7437 / KCTC 9190 / NBRC 14626 / NCTC 10488 / NRRL B-5397 / IMRU 509) TaxID=446468 RepID=D7B377_NOCDD|nr:MULTISPECIES: substrate-binding domain-containing protein [Nocardiopsis]ADH66805.1 periplasmic binding protein/LacI transcriptional regulator [Nocardiopsis dassonvillei subsp. dassonvillei DSM 43111]APC35078.1 sugar ABC transporter substrate-binding protein [Nocardiopsis dassonvillei]ASU57912.1 sugar ABC transporter substrate-binding protein [Nocardiopsis dassonvillei]NKY80008.1 sugar ABC transporter substrate-binding protein [Nocardiopsis dassonvillei]VEI86471.1 ABC transporter periplasmic